MRTEVVHCKKTDYDIYIGRPPTWRNPYEKDVGLLELYRPLVLSNPGLMAAGLQWGNPYKIGDHGSRSDVIELYREYVLSCPELMEKHPSLKGKKLGCWCSPKACHGDVLVELIDGYFEY